MKCPKCQTENREARKFCLECGEKLFVVCVECGVENLNTFQIKGREPCLSKTFASLLKERLTF